MSLWLSHLANLPAAIIREQDAMTPNEFLDLLAVDEQRGVEFKNARARNDTNWAARAPGELSIADMA